MGKHFVKLFKPVMMKKVLLTLLSYLIMSPWIILRVAAFAVYTLCLFVLALIVLMDREEEKAEVWTEYMEYLKKEFRFMTD